MKAIAVVMFAWGLGACDAVEQSLQGSAAPLREPDLPNCSRILNCCTNLDRQSIVPSSIKEACHGVATPTDTLIDQYQVSRANIQASTSTSAETKAQLIAELRTNTQASLEPACRCLLEETVGNISLDGFLSPADCETITTSGALPDGAQCDDVTGVIKSP